MCGTGPAGTIPPEPSGARPKRPRGFSRGSERETSESEAGVAARFRRRDGRSSSARISRKPEREHISRDRRNNRQRVSLLLPERWAESLRRERFHRSSAGRGQKGRAAFPVDRSGKRRNRRQELRRVLCAATGVRPARGFPQTGAGNISPATDGITVSGFPFPDRSNGGTGPAGTIPPEPSGARPKRPRGFSGGPELETSESEARVAARLMRRDGRSSSAGFLRVLGVRLLPPTADESIVSV
jgi:hypothetical protein